MKTKKNTPICLACAAAALVGASTTASAQFELVTPAPLFAEIWQFPPPVLGPSDFDVVDIPGDVEVAIPGFARARASVRSHFLGVSVSADAPGSGAVAGHLGTYFSVPDMTNAVLSWNFTGDGGQLPRESFVRLTGGSLNIFEDTGSGQLSLVLQPDVVYQLTGTAIETRGLGFTSSFRIVPAPGAATLLGLAGLVAVRRRR